MTAINSAPFIENRAFWEKPIDARKAFLRDNSVCYKCCALTSPIAKNCKTKCQCSECKSERYHMALHPGPAPWIEADPATEYGGEGEKISPKYQVTSKCTEVCG